MECSRTAPHLAIHHIILIVDVAREVGGHELVLVPASPGSSPLSLHTSGKEDTT